METRACKTITVPGFTGSGEEHWQTYWERSDPTMVRFAPASWDEPKLTDWLSALDRSVEAASEPPSLVAHSLGCLLVAHWATRRGKGDAERRVKRAFLVALSDPDNPTFPRAEAATFLPVPSMKLPFPTLIVASTDDPYTSVERSRYWASSWGADLIFAGPLGHINSASHLGHWNQGKTFFEHFCATR